MLTNPFVQKDGFTQRTVWCWGNWMSPKVNCRNLHSKDQTFKSHFFYRLCWALNFTAKGLSTIPASNERYSDNNKKKYW